MPTPAQQPQFHAVAALGMYDWPEVADATNAFWSCWRDHIRRRGLEAPEILDRGRSLEDIWRDPNLLAAQTCGAPFVDGLIGVVDLIATPVYDAEGCEGTFYVSWIVAGAGSSDRDLAEVAAAPTAVNSRGSYSGWVALLGVAPEPQNVILTGSHRESARAVASGEAEFAALDAVSYRLLRRHEPETAAKLRLVAKTKPAPGLPYVTAAGGGEDRLRVIREALQAALSDPEIAGSREALGLLGAEYVDVETYRAFAASRSA